MLPQPPHALSELPLWAGCGCVCSPGLGSRLEIRSEAHCLAGKTRIIFLTFSFLHATMKENRMSKLFGKISPYNKKTPPSAPCVLICIDSMSRAPSLCVHMYVCVCLCFSLFFLTNAVELYLYQGEARIWDKKGSLPINLADPPCTSLYEKRVSAHLAFRRTA